ncbi:MAG: helix-turn-helix domain-containing protein, partial [Candidatus Sulfotelmatobacter sp.]
LTSVQAALPNAVLSNNGSAGTVSTTTFAGTLAERVDAFERETILAELKLSHSNVSLAAKSLGLERSHLYKKAEQLGIDLRAVRREQESAKD